MIEPLQFYLKKGVLDMKNIETSAQNETVESGKENEHANPFGLAFVSEVAQDATGGAEVEASMQELCKPLGIISTSMKVKNTDTPNDDYEYDDVDDE